MKRKTAALFAAMLLFAAHSLAASAPEYSPEDRQALRAIAHDAIAAKLDGKPYSLPKNLPAKFLEPRGAFVTLKRNGHLRGCIGRIVSNDPLAATIAEMAQAAAFEDPRFPPLDPSEFPSVALEISVLTPPAPIASIRNITVGVHGLIMRNGLHSGLLLPQVPTEYGWDKITFLEETCAKAGLQQNCWKDPATRMETFSAEVF